MDGMTDEHLLELAKLMRQWADSCIKMLEMQRRDIKRTQVSDYEGIYQKLLKNNRTIRIEQ